MATKITNQQKAQDQYLEAHFDAQTLVETIQSQIQAIDEKLFDMPAPDDEDRLINWRDVSIIAEIKGRLLEAKERLQYATEVFNYIKY